MCSVRKPSGLVSSLQGPSVRVLLAGAATSFFSSLRKRTSAGLTSSESFLPLPFLAETGRDFLWSGFSGLVLFDDAADDVGADEARSGAEHDEAYDGGECAGDYFCGR